MVELVAVSPFAGVLKSAGQGAGLVVVDRDGLGIVSLQAFKGRGDALAAAIAALGLSLPETPSRLANGATAIIGIGPGRWLITREAAANRLYVDLAPTLGPIAALNDQSDGYAVLRLSGPALYAVLEKGVQVDLHPDAFPVGAAATTAIAHIGVTLWRLPDEDNASVFEVALFRSMAGSFWHWLEASGAEFGVVVGEG